MRIVIDLQGLQTASKYRGIGHYTFSLVKEMIESNPDDDFVLLVANQEAKDLKEIYSKFEPFFDIKKVKVFSFLNGCIENSENNLPLILISELIREHYIQMLKPDFVLVSSLFEGASDKFCCSIYDEHNYGVGTIGYDLIPLVDEDKYLSDPQTKNWYYRKVEQLENNDFIFSISESSKIEFKKFTNIEHEKLVNISSGCSDDYKVAYGEKEENELRNKLDLFGDYILYSGACDPRKNLNGLIAAYSQLNKDIIKNHKLVLVGKYNERQMELLRKSLKKAGGDSNQIIFTGFISNAELNILYSNCKVFVFPSFYEGFGLPVLEAMTCGAPVICSNISSLPEVIDLPEATFNPHNINEIKELIEKAISDITFRDLLLDNAKKRSEEFSWEKSSKLLMDTLKQENFKYENIDFDIFENRIIENIASIVLENDLSDDIIMNAASCISLNKKIITF